MYRALLYLSLILISACSSTSGRSQTIEFRHFIRDFFGGEDFQAAHTQFPLEVVSWTGDSEVTSTSVTRIDWEFYKGPAYFQCEKNCYDIVIYDDFAKSQSDSGERVLAFEGISNGINSSMYFRLTNGKWYLVKIEDFNN